MNHNDYLSVATEVRDALASGRPVVALESTIIAHGMPYPQNVQTATEVEGLVRQSGSVPATIAVLGGKLCVGLGKEQIEELGSEANVWKVSVRDLPYVVSNRLPGATTVAATMRVAHLAGIRVFVTGGIGGVHRGAGASMDISADLTELSRTPVAVVCAGVKSILDIGLTLEYLETMGVPVVTVGQEGFPSFYSRESGHTSPLRIDSAAGIADMLRAQWGVGFGGGAVIANPIPAPFEIPFSQMERVIEEALSLADRQSVTGKRLTPFLLKTIADRTGGKSLAANIALVRHNAVLGGNIAALLSSTRR